MVTGHDEAQAVYNDSAQFSSCNAVSGPFVKFPEPFEGDDVTDIIERHRDMLPFSDQLPAFDPPRHTAHRALMMRLLRSEEHTSELQSLMRTSYAVFCLKQKTETTTHQH